MNPLRIAVFVGAFPEVSETFIVRQITGLLDVGHEVDIYADTRADPNTPLHSEVERYRLLERACFMEMPPEASPFEMPAFPITSRTWPPGSETSIHNAARVARALPVFFQALSAAGPALAVQALRPSQYGYQAASLSAIYRLARLSSVRKRYDVLHAHFGPVGNSFRFARQLWRAPLMVSFHGYDLCTVPRQEGSDVYKKLFEMVDAVTAHSDYAARCLTALGCSSDKVRRLHVGVDPEAFAFRARKLCRGQPVRILTVARLVEIKGLEFSISAVAQVCKQYPDTHYDIIGDGPMCEKLTELVRSLGLEKQVSLLGARSGNEVRSFMDRADLFVLPSINLEGDQEGTPVTLMEAQACGLPVVATLTGGIPEVVRNGISGFLVADRDPEALAERVNFLIEHAERWPEIGQAGRRHIEEKYDIRKLNQRLVELYQSTIDTFGKNSTPSHFACVP